MYWDCMDLKKKWVTNLITSELLLTLLVSFIFMYLSAITDKTKVNENTSSRQHTMFNLPMDPTCPKLRHQGIQQK